MVCTFESKESCLSSVSLLFLLYSSEQVNSIRQMVVEILRDAGLSHQAAASALNERLLEKKEEGISFSHTYLSRMRNFGLTTETSSLESLYRLPFLYLLSDRYSRSQVLSIVLGQDPVEDPMRVQLSKNKYFLGFKELQSIFSDAPQKGDYYKGRRGFSDLYLDYQIYRIRKVANFVINIENKGISRAVLAEEINRRGGYPLCREMNLTNLVNVGSSNGNSNMNILCCLPSLACLSDRFSVGDLKQVALGQTPSCMEEEELQELQEWRDRLRKVVASTSSLDLPLFSACSPLKSTFSEYMHSRFRELNMNWDQGIRTLLSYSPDQDNKAALRELEDVLRGRNKKPTGITIAMVKWVFFCVFDQEFSRQELLDLINR